MRIQTKCKADVVGFSIKRNKTHDGKDGYVDLDIGVDQENAEEQFGSDFEGLAFSTMRFTDEHIYFLQDTIKPGSRIVCEKHEIDIDGHRIKDQPELMSIKTVEGSAHVVARIRLPIDASNSKLVSSLTKSVGELVQINFDPEQGVLPLKKRKSKDAEEAEEVA